MDNSENDIVSGESGQNATSSVSLSSEQLETLTGKIDEVIFYQQNNYTVNMFTLVSIIIIFVLYLIYKFIASFIEF